MSADKIHLLPKAGLAGRLLRLYYTLRPLRWQQYWYRLWYPVKRRCYRQPAVPARALAAAGAWHMPGLHPLPAFDRFDPAERSFSLLNIRQAYPGNINWNEPRHGLLWAYHLNYFGWLRDETLPVETQLALIRTYARDGQVYVGKDSYPTSLRSIAWIRFFARHAVKEDALHRSLYRQVHRLYHFPEYQLQGNHLWENGCALLMAGTYFDEPRFYRKGRRIFMRALKEQVLPDGGHIEGSPMYHSLLLGGLLQCLEFLSRCGNDEALTDLMRGRAARMLGWLEQVSFYNGQWPQVNDSTGGIAPDWAALQAYAAVLSLRAVPVPLKESGYRMLRNGPFELFIDATDIRPAWQPGHAHADALSFCLHAGGIPVVVDPGVTTYEVGAQRSWQRSTDAHNTVTVDRANSSDIWKSFRVGRKARVTILEEAKDSLKATHDGYTGLGVEYEREFKITDHKIIIQDKVKARRDKNIGLNLHFHPDIDVKKIDDSEFLASNLRVVITNAKRIAVEPYIYAEAFNKPIEAKRIRVEALSSLSITLENITC